MEKNDTNEKYYRQNGVVVEGKEIKTVRTQQLKDTIRNARLGTYNAHGRYILSPRITKEILSVTKYIYKEHFDEVIRESKNVFEFKAVASIPVFGQMEFRLVFKDKIAKLYMIENVYREFNGYQEIYGEQITMINCEDEKDNLVDYVFSLLNITVVDEAEFGKIPEEDPEKVKSIVLSKLYFTMVAKDYLKSSSDDERDTFDDMVDILKKGGDYGKKILRRFIDRIEKRPDIMQLKDDDGYNEALNDAIVGAAEVSTTEDDLQDPKNRETYEKLLRRRYRDAERDFDRAKHNVDEKDLKKVADAVLGHEAAEKLFKDKEEVASIIKEKDEEVVQKEQDNSLLDTLLKSKIVQNVVTKVFGNKEEQQGKEQKGENPFTEKDAAKTEEQAAAADKANETAKGQQGPNSESQEGQGLKTEEKPADKTEGKTEETAKDPMPEPDVSLSKKGKEVNVTPPTPEDKTPPTNETFVNTGGSGISTQKVSGESSININSSDVQKASDSLDSLKEQISRVEVIEEEDAIEAFDMDANDVDESQVEGFEEKDPDDQTFEADDPEALKGTAKVYEGEEYIK